MRPDPDNEGEDDFEDDDEEEDDDLEEDEDEEDDYEGDDDEEEDEEEDQEDGPDVEASRNFKQVVWVIMVIIIFASFLIISAVSALGVAEFKPPYIILAILLILGGLKIFFGSRVK